MAWYDDITQLLGNPTFQMAAGIPLAGFGAYELARGRPSGALLGTLGGLGTYFGEQGLQQARDTAQKRKSLLTQVKLLGQRPEYKGSKGLLQQIAGIAGKGDIGEVEGAEAQLNELIKFTDAQQKKQKEAIPGIYNAAARVLTGNKRDFEELTADEVKKIPGVVQNLQNDPKFALMQQQQANALQKMDKSEAAHMQALIQSEGASAARQERSEAASAARQDKAIAAASDRTNKLIAATINRTEPAGPKGPTVKGYDNIWEPDIGGWLYTPAIAGSEGLTSTLVGAGLKAVGKGSKPFVRLKGGAKRWSLTETKTLKDGRTVTGVTLPDGSFYSPE